LESDVVTNLGSQGFKTFGFAGGRADVFEPEEDIYWGALSAQIPQAQSLKVRGPCRAARRRTEGLALRALSAHDRSV